MCMKNMAAIIYFALLYAVLLMFDARATTQKPMPILLRVEVTTHDRKLTNKFLFPFSVPKGFMFIGIHGTVSTVSKANKMSETLLSLHAAKSADCPQVGENISDYSKIFAKYPETGLGAIISKQARAGEQTVPVNVNLPVGVPLVSSCLYLVFDGSDFSGGPYKMAANLTALIAPQREPFGAIDYSSQDEFILGDNNVDNAFKITHILKDTTLLAVFGNFAATTLPGTQYRPPQGVWKMRHEILLYKGGCPMFPNQDQDSNQSRLNQSTLGRPVLYDTTIQGQGDHAYYASVQRDFKDDINLHQGDCLVHAIHSSTSAAKQTGAYNSEAQIFYETSEPASKHN